MPKGQNKKINYKILTADNLIEEKHSETKSIERKNLEEFNPEVVSHVEDNEEERTSVITDKSPISKLTVDKDSSEVSSLGIIYPKEEQQNVKELYPEIESLKFKEEKTEELPQKNDNTFIEENEFLISPATEEIGIYKKSYEEEEKEDLTPPSENLIYPSTTLSSSSTSSIFASSLERRTKILKIFFLSIPVFAFILLIVFLKPYEKLRLFLGSNSNQGQEQQNFQDGKYRSIFSFRTSSQTSSQTTSQTTTNIFSTTSTFSTSTSGVTTTVFISANESSTGATLTSLTSKDLTTSTLTNTKKFLTSSIFGFLRSTFSTTTNSTQTSSVSPTSALSTTTKRTTTKSVGFKTTSSKNLATTSLNSIFSTSSSFNQTTKTVSRGFYQDSSTRKLTSSVATSAATQTKISLATSATSSKISKTTSTATTSITSTVISKTTSSITSSVTTSLTTSKKTEKNNQNLTTTIVMTSTNYSFPSKDIEFLDFVYFEDIKINNLDKNIFESALRLFLNKQDYFGSKLGVNFIYENKKIPLNFIFDYFINSSKISLDKLKSIMTGNYTFLVYYGYTRKYPVLIFEVNNIAKAKQINQQWEINGMANDLQTLFLGVKIKVTNQKFSRSVFDSYEYRVINLGYNYKIIWAVIKNYLIYSTTESGLKEIIKSIK